MVELELCRALRAFVEDAVKDLQLPVEPFEEILDAEEYPEEDAGPEVKPKEPSPTEEYALCRTPKVFNGYLPYKDEDVEAYGRDFPFIVVRPEEAASTRDSTIVTVSLTFGAYSQRTDGYEHCLNMVSRVRNALMSMPFLTLDDRYLLEDGITWRGETDQPKPYWFVVMTTRWIYRSPQPVSGVEDL